MIAFDLNLLEREFDNGLGQEGDTDTDRGDQTHTAGESGGDDRNVLPPFQLQSLLEVELSDEGADEGGQNGVRRALAETTDNTVGPSTPTWTAHSVR